MNTFTDFDNGMKKRLKAESEGGSRRRRILTVLSSLIAVMVCVLFVEDLLPSKDLGTSSGLDTGSLLSEAERLGKMSPSAAFQPVGVRASMDRGFASRQLELSLPPLLYSAASWHAVSGEKPNFHSSQPFAYEPSQSKGYEFNDLAISYLFSSPGVYFDLGFKGHDASQYILRFSNAGVRFVLRLAGLKPQELQSMKFDAEGYRRCELRAGGQGLALSCGRGATLKIAQVRPMTTSSMFSASNAVDGDYLEAELSGSLDGREVSDKLLRIDAP